MGSQIYLGVWFDVKLTFKEHIQKMIEKCKQGINVLECLSGYNWGASSLGTPMLPCARFHFALLGSLDSMDPIFA
jgi:hypothetical protein